MKICGIYKITNQLNGKGYIGQSVDIKKRWNAHINDDRKKNQYAIHMAIKKYGKENFKFEILERCDQKQLNEREIYWIAYYHTYEKGYNLTPGGNNSTQYDYEEIANLWKDGKLCNEIASIIKCSQATVTNALRAFDISEEEVRHRSNLSQCKPVVALSIDNHTPLKYFDSTLAAAKFFNASTPTAISTAIKHYKDNWSLYGYYWNYANEKNLPVRELTNEDFLAFSRRKKPCVTQEYREQMSMLFRTVERPTRDELKTMIRCMSFTAIGKQYNVSDNGIRKWCDFYHLPRRIKDIKEYSDEEWENI